MIRAWGRPEFVCGVRFSFDSGGAGGDDVAIETPDGGLNDGTPRAPICIARE
jgi:hypothetical protein